MKTPWAILLCKFNDNDDEPFSRTFYENLFTEAGLGTLNMVEFFTDVSHGTLDLSGSKVLGWYTLDKKRSEYTGSGLNGAGRLQLVDWAKSKATSAGDSLDAFWGVVVCMNVPTDLWGGGGRQAVCDNRSMDVSLLGQEMGHGYGLQHSRADGSTEDYRDRWDVMSTVRAFIAPHPTYTHVGPGLNAANMAGRDWFDLTRVWNEGGSGLFNSQVKLRPLYRRDLPGFLVAQVGEYFVEYRAKEKWDASIPQEAVLVHRLDDNYSYIMAGPTGGQALVEGSRFETLVPGRFVVRVDVLDIDAAAQTATLWLARMPPPPPPPPFDHCALIRRVIRANKATVMEAYRRRQSATSQEERDKLDRDIEEVGRELDVLYDEFQFRGCHGVP